MSKLQWVNGYLSEVITVTPSWLETYAEICFEIGSRLSSNQLENNNGRMALHTLAFDLANEFEAIHNDRQWDGEWFDELNNFLTEKLK